MSVELATAYVALKVDGSQVPAGVKKSMAGAEAQITRTGAKSGKSFGSMFSRAFGTVGGALAVGALIKSSSKLEQSYSKTMSLVAASTSAPKAELQRLDDLAMKLGADTQYSANEAAGAMLELGKAGISTSDIYGGALKNTLLLASAGSTDLGTAATIASNAMNTFNLKGPQMASVAAALAGGANASSASVESLGQALQQVGPGATNAGLNLQQTVGVLSAFDAAGIKASDSGTSLKTMLARLVPQTDKARTAMERAGLDFVKADGSFVSITNVADQLQKKLGPLSEAQRQQALTTIFGSDASRAATVLMNEGAEGLGKYIKATKDQTAAEKMSKAAMSGTAGAMERLSGAAETAQLKLGTALAPAVTDLANWTSTKALPAVTDFIDGMQNGTGAGGDLADTLGVVRDVGGDVLGVAKKLVGAFNDLPGPVKEYGIKAGIAAFAVKKLVDAGKGLSGLKGGALKLGGVAASSRPVPVFVTNPGFSGVPGKTPGKTPTGVPIGGAAKGSWFQKLIGSNAFKFGALPAAVTLGSAGTSYKPGTMEKPGDRGLIDPKTMNPGQIALLSEAEKRMFGLDKAARAAAQSQSAAAAAMNVAGSVLTSTNPKLAKYGKQLQDLPPEVRTKVETPGAVTSLSDVRALQQRYNLTPKQVRTLINLSGAKPAKSATDALIGSLNTADRKNAKPKVNQQGAGPSKGAVDNLIGSLNRIPRYKDVTIRVNRVGSAAFNAGATLLPGGRDLPGRAGGGPVRAGYPYTVGEHRREVFIPDTSGRIVNPQLGGGGGGPAVFHLYDVDDQLIGTMSGVADDRVLANAELG